MIKKYDKRQGCVYEGETTSQDISLSHIPQTRHPNHKLVQLRNSLYTNTSKEPPNITIHTYSIAYNRTHNRTSRHNHKMYSELNTLTYKTQNYTAQTNYNLTQQTQQPRPQTYIAQNHKSKWSGD